MPGSPQRRRSFAPRLVSLGLLVLQTLGPGGVALAHAADQTGGAASIETRHTEQCAVLHDSSRCALCQFAQMRAAATPALRPLPVPLPARRTLPAPRPFVPAGASRPAAPSRGPPALLA